MDIDTDVVLSMDTMIEEFREELASAINAETGVVYEGDPWDGLDWNPTTL